MAGGLWFCIENGYDVEHFKYLVMIITITTGLLMVSNFRYSSFKEIDFKNKVPFIAAIVAMLVISFVMAQPQRMLFLLSVAYAASGPIVTLVMRKKRLQSRKT
jgi:CDP-diacylglycerol--serine O-phosphatidyltransferase